MSLSVGSRVLPGWFARPVEQVAPELLGCWLVRRSSSGQLWRGMIVETEAYGPGDPACHGYRKVTNRNRPMFGPPGLIYVYLIYGIYHCLNLVTDAERIPSAVLIRALELDAATLTDLAQKSTEGKTLGSPHRWAAGPGKLCRVLDINRDLSGAWLSPAAGLWVEPPLPTFQAPAVQTKRIGISQGQELLWRWYIKDNPAVSTP